MKSFKSGYSLICTIILALSVVASVFIATSCGGGSASGNLPVYQNPGQSNGGNGAGNPGGNPPGDSTSPPGDGQAAPPPADESGGEGTAPPSDGGSTPPGDGGTIPPGDSGGSTPPPDSADSAVKGTIDVGGIPVSDASGLPADVTRVSLKVIDPSEEIGDTPTAAPSPTGSYKIGGLASAKIRYLNVSFNTSVDLKGVGQLVTPVSVNLPIQLASGVSTKINASIAVYAPKSAASVRSASKDGGGSGDDGGDDGDDDAEDYGSIEISYSYDGPDGARAERFVIDYRTNETVYDLDEDGSYDDDLSHVDGDNDGIRDDRLSDDQQRDDYIDVDAEGLVEDIGTEFIKVTGVLFIIDERTSFKDEMGQSLISIGDSVKIKGYTTPSGSMYAEEIELESESG